MFLSSLKFLLRFDDNPNGIAEEVSNTRMETLGTDVVASVSNSGYILQEDQYLFGSGVSGNGFSTSMTTEYTVGFWVYSTSVGVAVDSNTGNLLSIERPLLNFVDGTSAEDSIIEITEHTEPSGNSSLRILERGGYYTFSEEYTSDRWHHFWITRNNSEIRIFIDGVESSLINPTGDLLEQVAAGLNANLYTYINHSLDGYGTAVSKNSGMIDDIFLLNVENTSQSDIQKVINDGVKYVVDDVYNGFDVVKTDFYSIDPDTITVNSMIDDLSYVFVGRNDGKIMRGSPLLWETRRTFANSEEYLTGGIGGASTDGFLDFNQDTIRL